MVRPLLSVLLCLSLGACASARNTALISKVDKIRVGTVTAAAPDAKSIEKEFKSARLKRGVAESLLILAGGVAAGAIGGQGGTNNYIVQTTQDRASSSASPVAGNSIADLSAGEVAVQSRIVQLAVPQQSAALNRALSAYLPTSKRVSRSGAWRLDCRITVAGHDRRKKHHYLWLEGKATLTGPDGVVVWESGAYGDSDTGYGGAPAAPVATMQEFLTPAVLNDHIRAATAYLAQGVAEGLAGDLGWEE